MIVGKGKVDFTAMTAILTRAAIIVVIAAAAQWLTNICNNRMTYNIVRDIRRDALFKHWKKCHFPILTATHTVIWSAVSSPMLDTIFRGTF